MIIIISPAKTIDFSLPFAASQTSKPSFASDANTLAKELKAYKTSELAQLMSISNELALLNYERFQSWNNRSTPQKPALSVFKGEVYNGMKAWEWSEDLIEYAQDHLRILSGLYGILRPLDLMKAYRLEMGTKLESGTLYDFWGDKITKNINRSAANNGRILVNLASKEYSRAANLKHFKGKVITPDFKDKHQGEYKMIAIYAKKARGLMVRFILENRIEDPQEMKAFDSDGYVFNSKMSTADNFVFTRG